MLFSSIESSMVVSLVNKCVFKRMVNIDLVNMVGIYTIDVSLSAESKENSNSWMWYALIVKVVCISQQNIK